MCILFWTVDNHPKYRFVFAGNRDEFLKRPTARSHFWEEPYQNVLAGTDLEVHPLEQSLKNGTWLGITKEGRFAALTNFRETNFRGTTSRGVLVRDFLLSSDSVQESIEHVKNQQDQYGGFSITFFDFGKDPTEMMYFTNRDNQPIQSIESGVVYGLSNSSLADPWPKVHRGKDLFSEALKQHSEGKSEEDLIEALFDMLHTSKPFHDEEDLTEVFKDLKETICVPKFDFPFEGIKEPEYATRTSTVVLIDYDGNVSFIERDWYDENLVPYKHGEFNDIVEHFKLP